MQQGTVRGHALTILISFYYCYDIIQQQQKAAFTSLIVLRFSFYMCLNVNN